MKCDAVVVMIRTIAYFFPMPTRALLLSLFLTIGCSMVLLATPVAVSSVHKNSNGVTLQMKPGMLRLEVLSPRIIRVTYGLDNPLPADKSLAVIGKPERANWTLAESADEISLHTDEIEARVNRASGAVGFFDKNGNPLLAETPDGGKSLTPAHVGGIDTLRSEQDFVLAPDEAIYGLGQHAQGLMDYRGTMVHLQQRNPTESAVPVLVSSRGYGMLWDNPAVTDVNVGRDQSQDHLVWTSEAADTIDYYFMSGPELDGVIADYRELDRRGADVRQMGFWFLAMQGALPIPAGVAGRGAAGIARHPRAAGRHHPGLAILDAQSVGFASVRHEPLSRPGGDDEGTACRKCPRHHFHLAEV